MLTEGLYASYSRELLAGNQRACAEIVTGLLQGGIDIRSLHVDLFQRSMYEVGALWEHNRISVAAEHLATCITGGLLSLVYPLIFARPHIGRSAVISCVANEWHELGGRMVADTFELNGWHGYFLGANTPIEALIAMVREKLPDLVALSLSIDSGLSSLVGAVHAIRSAFPDLPIVAGGQALRLGGRELLAEVAGVQVLGSLQELESMIRSYPEV